MLRLGRPRILCLDTGVGVSALLDLDGVAHWLQGTDCTSTARPSQLCLVGFLGHGINVGVGIHVETTLQFTLPLQLWSGWQPFSGRIYHLEGMRPPKGHLPCETSGMRIDTVVLVSTH